MTYPEFYIIGAAKAGTTTLVEYLRRHPSIFLPSLKEPEYFGRDGLYGSAEQWYLDLFRDARPGQLCGDASTIHSRWPHSAAAADRIAKHRPDARIIYLVREPVARAYSHYVQRVALARHLRGRLSALSSRFTDEEMRLLKIMQIADARGCVGHCGATFEDVLALSDIFINTSMYKDRLSEYLAHFERRQLKVVLFDDLRACPQRLVADILRFLEVDPIHANRMEDVVHANPAVSHFENEIRFRLSRYMSDSILLRGVSRAMPRWLKDISWRLVSDSTVLDRIVGPVRPPPILESTRMLLQRQFEPSNQWLSWFLGRDLLSWGVVPRSREERQQHPSVIASQ